MNERPTESRWFLSDVVNEPLFTNTPQFVKRARDVPPEHMRPGGWFVVDDPREPFQVIGRYREWWEPIEDEL